MAPSLSSMMRDPFGAMVRQIDAARAEAEKYRIKIKSDLTTGAGLVKLADRLLRDFLAGKMSERRFEVAMRGIKTIAQLKKQFGDELEAGGDEEVAEELPPPPAPPPFAPDPNDPGVEVIVEDAAGAYRVGRDGSLEPPAEGDTRAKTPPIPQLNQPVAREGRVRQADEPSRVAGRHGAPGAEPGRDQVAKADKS